MPTDLSAISEFA